MLGSLDPFLARLSRDPASDVAAVADNCRFDERASELRWQAFSDCLPHDDHARLDFADWGEADRLHYERRVRVLSTSTPDAFLDINQEAWLLAITPDQEVVRLEALDRPLASIWNTNLDSLQSLLSASASQPDAKKTVEEYFDDWNRARDCRPSFAAFLDEVKAEVEEDDWPHRLRDRLGLGHYSPEHGTRIPVALMCYTLQEAFNVKARTSIPSAFALPTVLDGGMHPYFFPVPREHPYGATLHLADGLADLICAEILHCRIEYRPKHLRKLGWIERPHNFHATTADRDARLRSARDLHLLQLRIVSGCEDFGAEMAGRS